MDNFKFKLWDLVFKPKGYEYPGKVVARFRSIAGAERYVVENSLAVGMLHIFSPTQLELDQKKIDLLIELQKKEEGI